MAKMKDLKYKTNNIDGRVASKRIANILSFLRSKCAYDIDNFTSINNKNTE